jgi:hypothetical protein
MKKLVIFAVLALLLGVVVVAEAKPRGGDDPPPPPPPPPSYDDLPLDPCGIKWSQLPEMFEQWGYDVESNHDIDNNEPNVVVMDDFMCWDGMPITDVHWWGSYFGRYNPDDNPIIGFHISFHKDIAAYGVPEDPDYIASHPGGLVVAWDMPFEEAHEVWHGVDSYGDDVYQYFIDLPVPFLQEQYDIYWLDIKAILNDVDGNDEPVWGWHTAVQPHWQDDAVVILDYDQATGDYGSWFALEHHMVDEYGEPTGEVISLDMAFELTTIPEPMTLIMIGGALAGLAAIARRKM